jgi:fumarate reductase subunit D
MSGITDRAGATAKSAGREAQQSDWVEHAARLGLLAYGVVHLVVGWLALQLAFGDREGSASSQGAVHELAQQPFGDVLVWAVGLGMVLLALWQGIEALFGHRQYDGKERLGKRLASAGKAVVYVVIAVSAIKTAMGSGSSSSEKQTDTLTARLMDLPAGQLLVGAVGLAILGVGGYFVLRAWTEKFAKELDAEGKSGTTGTAYLWLGKLGYTAKGVAFGIVGALFVYAALTHEPHKSGGLDQALTELLDKPAGPFLLGLVALGIGCYGLFCFARARHLSR